jgi:prepilin-type N-terminal cleavage/methylation domain-containing protein
MKKLQTNFQNKINKKGFTLVELLVSIALFSLVLVAVISAIVTVMDVNKKARTLSLIMNELNFSIENMNRSIKTGEIESSAGIRNNLTVLDQYGDTVTYSLDEGTIVKNVDGETLDVTSPEIQVDSLKFAIFNTDTYSQPFVVVSIQGNAKIGGRIQSDFNIQTSISQRKLNLPD